MAFFILFLFDKEGNAGDEYNLLISKCFVLLKDNPLFVMQYDKENVVEAKFRELENESCKSDQSDTSFFRTLKSNTDLLACKAEYYHQCGEYQKCFDLTYV